MRGIFAIRALWQGDPSAYLTGMELASEAYDRAGDLRNACMARVNMGSVLLEVSSPNELRSHFAVTASEATDRPGTYLVTMVPKTQLELPVDQTTAVMRLIERLEDLDDVTRVYTNIHISDEVLAQAAAS